MFGVLLCMIFFFDCSSQINEQLLEFHTVLAYVYQRMALDGESWISESQEVVVVFPKWNFKFWWLVTILSQPSSAMTYTSCTSIKCCHSWTVAMSPLSPMLCFYDVLCPCWFIIIPSFKFSPCPPSWILNTNILTARISVAGLGSGHIAFYTVHSVLFGYPSTLWVYESTVKSQLLEYAVVVHATCIIVHIKYVPTCITCTYTYTPNAKPLQKMDSHI